MLPNVKLPSEIRPHASLLFRRINRVPASDKVWESHIDKRVKRTFVPVYALSGPLTVIRHDMWRLFIDFQLTAV